MQVIRNPMTVDWYYIAIEDTYRECVGSDEYNYILLGAPGWPDDHPMSYDKTMCRKATYEEVCNHYN
jgi:hypothetical protein